MPEEIEIETKELRDTIEELREERAERATEQKSLGWMRWISLATALMAVLAAVAALESGSLVNEALIKKNESVFHQAQASDQWAYYQAKGIKSNGAAQTSTVLKALHVPDESAKLLAASERYADEQKEIKHAAEDLELERDASAHESAELLHAHHKFALSVTLTQVAIALAAVAALTRRKPIWLLSIAAGSAGLIIFVIAYANLPRPQHGHENRKAAAPHRNAPQHHKGST